MIQRGGAVVIQMLENVQRATIRAVARDAILSGLSLMDGFSTICSKLITKNNTTYGSQAKVLIMCNGQRLGVGSCWKRDRRQE